MYAKVINIRFPPNVTEDVASVARGLGPILKDLQGYESLEVLPDPEAGEGMIVSFWEKEADAGGERDQRFLYRADEHDIELPLRGFGSEDIRGQHSGVGSDT